MSTRNYDREFKLNAVKLYRESQKPMTKICKVLEIPICTLSGWFKEFKSHGEERMLHYHLFRQKLLAHMAAEHAK